VHQGDYVLKLTEGLAKPEETAALYVTTPKLVDAFDRALGLVGDALRSGQSKATYLHGSFGSGKSHFMAMLSLLLQGHEAAWRVADFHPLRPKHPFAGKQKLLELHFHMIVADSLESKLFLNYIEYVQQQHPEAALPGLFAD
jgi:predicted ATPase